MPRLSTETHTHAIRVSPDREVHFDDEVKVFKPELFIGGTFGEQSVKVLMRNPGISETDKIEECFQVTIILVSKRDMHLIAHFYHEYNDLSGFYYQLKDYLKKAYSLPSDHKIKMFYDEHDTWHVKVIDEFEKVCATHLVRICPFYPDPSKREHDFVIVKADAGYSELPKELRNGINLTDSDGMPLKLPPCYRKLLPTLSVKRCISSAVESTPVSDPIFSSSARNISSTPFSLTRRVVGADRKASIDLLSNLSDDSEVKRLLSFMP